MSIALDATYSVGDQLTGVGVYSTAILHGLAAAHPDETFYWCYRPHRLWRGLRETAPPSVRRRLLGERWHPRADVFHGLNQRLPAHRPKRAVTTFHDLFVMTSDYSTRDFRQRFAALARDAADRSDLVIAVSDFTAGQVHTLLGVDRARIRVAPHGVDPRPDAAIPREPLILSLGALQARKNLVRLVEAFEQIDAPGWRLVLAGSHGYGAAEILTRIEKSSKRAAISLPGFVSNEKRRALYARASLFAFPSLDEGFGIPVLEAMAAGLPVLTSNRSSLPEVAGSAALLVDPSDSAAIAAGMQTLVDDSAMRADLAAKGRRRAAEFTWDRAVATTWNVYEELRG